MRIEDVPPGNRFGKWPRRYMGIRQMRYLVEIIEAASFSQASRNLGIAQPALSQQISRMEHDIGTPLLVRSSRGVSPTGAGQIVYSHAKTILRQIEQAMQAARETTDHITGRVTLGLPPTTMSRIGVPLTRRLRERHPGIQLNLIEGLSGDLQRQAIAGDLDMTVLFVQDAVPGWTCLPILREELFLVLPLESPLVPRTATGVTLKQAASLPLILPSPKHGLRRRIDLEFERQEIAIVPVAEIDSLTVLMQCLAQGMGATIKPSAATNVLGPEHAGRWRCLCISDIRMTRVNYLHSSAAARHLPGARAVAGELVDLARSLTENEAWLGCDYIGAVPSLAPH